MSRDYQARKLVKRLIIADVDWNALRDRFLSIVGNLT